MIYVQVDASKVDSSKYGDAYFKAAEKKAKAKGEEAFFQEGQVRR